MPAVTEEEGQQENQQGEGNQEWNQDGNCHYDDWSSWGDHDWSREWVSLDDWSGDWAWSGMWNRLVPQLRPDLRLTSLRTPPRLNRRRM